MKFAPGSTLWLLQHELRLHWRGLRRSTGSRVFLIIVLVLLHLTAIPLALAQSRIKLDQSRPATWLGGALLFVLLLMISRTLITAVQSLYARGDMDLLLSSPLKPEAIIAVRAAVIAVTVTLEFAALILPFVNVFVLFGLFAWARVYLVLPALGMLAATISLLLSLLLFRWFGARRTRVIAQVLSAVIGLLFVLAAQVPNALRMSDRADLAPSREALSALTSGAQSVLMAPGSLLLNSSLPAFLLAAGCFGIFALTMKRCGSRFIAASVASAGMPTRQRATKSTQRLLFRGNTRAVIIRKELRLVARDPWLLTQLLQQLIYVLPFGLLLWRRGSEALPLIWGMNILVASNVASALAWLTIAAEDAPELLRSAPLATRSAQLYKLQAAMLPILPLVLLPVIVLWRTHLWFSLCIAFCSLGSALCCALLHRREDRSGNRRDFRTRYKGSVGRSFIELFVILAWCGVCAVLVWLSPFK